MTLGLAVILISIFCVISIDKIYSLTILVGLLPTITGLRSRLKFESRTWECHLETSQSQALSRQRYRGPFLIGIIYIIQLVLQKIIVKPSKRALTDHFAATSVRISNARLNIFSWSISIPLFITEVIINFTSGSVLSPHLIPSVEQIILMHALKYFNHHLKTMIECIKRLQTTFWNNWWKTGGYNNQRFACDVIIMHFTWHYLHLLWPQISKFI